jgi:hypothetical protein
MLDVDSYVSHVSDGNRSELAAVSHAEEDTLVRRAAHGWLPARPVLEDDIGRCKPAPPSQDYAEHLAARRKTQSRLLREKTGCSIVFVFAQQRSEQPGPPRSDVIQIHEPHIDGIGRSVSHALSPFEPDLLAVANVMWVVIA